MPTSNFILAADIGGTHITSAVVNTADWSLISATEARHAVQSAKSAKSIFLDWKAALQQSIAAFKELHPTESIQQLGIAMPGPFDYEKGISYMQGQDKYDTLYGLSLKELLAEELDIPQLDIRFINDAAAFLQGEVFTQQLEQQAAVLGITLGTGLGSASWRKGTKAIDADLWNSTYRDGIFEEYLTTRWFTQQFEKQTGIACKGLKEIIQNYHTEPAYTNLLAAFAQQLQDFLAFFAKQENCQQFILGGNISKILPNLLQAHKEAFSPYQLHMSKLEEKAAIIGATTIFL